MEGEKTVNTVTIPVDEYIDLKMKAQNNMYLMDKLHLIEENLRLMDGRVYELEKLSWKLEGSR